MTMGVEPLNARDRQMVAHAGSRAMTDVIMDVAMINVMTDVVMTGVVMIDVMINMMINVVTDVMLTIIVTIEITVIVGVTGVTGEIEMIILMSIREETFIAIDLRGEKTIILTRTMMMVGPVSHIGVDATMTINVTPYEYAQNSFFKCSCARVH